MAPGERSESAISNEAQAVRTLASAHRLAGEIENEARRRADEVRAEAELWASQREQDTRARAEAMIAEANAERDRIWDQIRNGVGRATRQVGDLIRIREELRLDLHEAVRDSNSALTRLDDDEEDETARPAPPAWLPSDPAELPAAPAPSAPPPAPPISGRASEVTGQGSPLSPRGGAPVEDVAPAAPPPEPEAEPDPDAPSAGTEGTEPDPGAGMVALRAGPFESFLAVMRFERALAGVPEIGAVYVRRFASGEVDVEVEATAGDEQLAAALRGIEGVEAVQPVSGVLRVRMRPEPPSSG